MRGHGTLIAMRKRGVTPVYGVNIATDECQSDWPSVWEKFWRDYPLTEVYTAELFIGPKESSQLLDLRCLVGLHVTVNGMTSRRVREVAQAAIKSGAKRVIGCVFIPKGEMSELVEIIDSEGVMTWPA